jgi:hypothetical protein
MDLFQEIKKDNKISFFCNTGIMFQDGIIMNLTKLLKSIYKDFDFHVFTNTENVFEQKEYCDLIKNSKYVFIWNGSQTGCFWVIEICNYFKIPYCIFERGLFPQAPFNYIVDSKGICCRSGSLTEEKLDKSEITKNLENVKRHYQQKGVKRKTPRQKYVFVFQLEFDSTVYHYSDYKNNEEMVDKFVDKHTIDMKDVVICPHPRNKNIESKYRISNIETIKECEDAALAVGISSTTMYEILGMGCPVKILGGNDKLVHPINREWSSKELIIPCILQNQFDLSDPKEQILKKINRNLLCS